MQDIEEELRDVVFDYDNSRAMVEIADDFLKGDEYKPGTFKDDMSAFSKGSKMSTNSSHVRRNIDNAGVYNPLKMNKMTNRLDQGERERLDELLEDIDLNLDDVIKDKE